MAGTRKQKSSGLGKPPKKRPRVLLASALTSENLDALLELAGQWGWDLLERINLEGVGLQDLALDGALIDDLPPGRLASELRACHCPAVRLGRFPHPQDHLLPAVLPGIERAGRLAAEHFVERQFRELAFVSFNASDPGQDYHALFASFRKRASELGVNSHVHDQIRHGEAKLSNAERIERRSVRLADFLGNVPKPVGILAISPKMANRIYLMCKMQNVRVPEHVGILAMGDARRCLTGLMPLSAVDMAPLNRAKAAMELLRRLMNDEAPPEGPLVIPPSGVVGRESTDVLAVNDDLVADALRFIWTNLDHVFCVNDVVTAMGVNRRKLERLFRREVGRGISDELKRRRFAEFCRLLRSSDDRLANLAARVGYTSLEAMHRTFKRNMGMTPAAYRRQSRPRQS